MAKNLLIVHGGAPTTVINSSLYGAIRQAKKYAEIEHIWGASHGTSGVLQERFIELGELDEAQLEQLLVTPGSAIGTSRTHLTDEDYEKIVQIILKREIKYLLFNGGNGSMDTCGKLHKRLKEYGVSVVGIPKTVDNDIAVTDHCPGFGSAAKYMATITRDIGEDVKSMPIHISVIEAMGWNAGWITASSVLARKKPGDAPHLVYLPERSFHKEEFLEDVKKLIEKQGSGVVVVSEGLHDENGKPISEPVFQRGRDVFYSSVGSYLANLIVRELGYKARSETPGICNRSCIDMQSTTDREEAIQVGKFAVESAIQGKVAKWLALKGSAMIPIVVI